MHKIVYLMFVFQVVHFVADYTALSTQKMLYAKRYGRPIWPIFQHGAVHAILTSLLLLPFFSIEYVLSVFVTILITHTCIDTLKGRITSMDPLLLESKHLRPYWILMGLDQLAHQSVFIFLILQIIQVVNG